MFDILKNLRNYRKKLATQQQKLELFELKDSFYLKEINGSIYVVCNGKAVYEAAQDETAAEIVANLQKIRDTSIKFKEENETLKKSVI